MRSPARRPTVGRATELEQLEGRSTPLATEGSACVAVEGEPGIGKTRLLAELRQPRRGARLPRARRVGDGVRARPARSASGSTRSTPSSPRRSSTCDAALGRRVGRRARASVVPSLRRPAAPDTQVGRRRALPRAPRGAPAARAARRGPPARARARRPALERRRVDRAARRRCCAAGPTRPSCSRSRSAAARRRRACRPRSRRRRCAGSTLEQLSEAEAVELLARPRPAARGGRLPPRRRQPVLPRAARARPGGRRRSRPARDGSRRGAACPRPSPLRWPQSSRRCPPVERALLEAAAVAGEPFEPDLAAAIAELPMAEALGALDALLALDLVRPTAVPRRFVFRHPLVRRAVYESTRGGWTARRARPRGRCARRTGRRADRARTPRRAVRRAGRRGGDRGPARGRRGGRAARARPRPCAGSTARCGSCPTPTASDRSTCGSRSPRRSASLGELERCRATLLEAIELLPRRRGRAARRADDRSAPRSSTGSAATTRRTGGSRAPGTSSPTARARRPRRCRSSSPSTGSTSSTSSRRPRWGAARWRRPARSATAR